METLGLRIKERTNEWRTSRKIDSDSSLLYKRKMKSQLKLLEKSTMCGYSAFVELMNDKGAGEEYTYTYWLNFVCLVYYFYYSYHCFFFHERRRF